MQLEFFIIFFISCLIVAMVSFFNGMDRAKKETIRKLENLAKFEKEVNDEQR